MERHWYWYRHSADNDAGMSKLEYKSEYSIIDLRWHWLVHLCNIDSLIVIFSGERLLPPLFKLDGATDGQTNGRRNWLTRPTYSCIEISYWWATLSKTGLNVFTGVGWRDAEVVGLSAAFTASAPALSFPLKCRYSISSYPFHECGSDWLSWPLPLPLLLPFSLPLPIHRVAF